jgi:DHA2 family multidrug resistance protein
MSAATTANAPGAVTVQVKHRGLLTACAMLATLMQIVDSTIANVALPHIQGSLSTTLDQVMWVLTSYVIASAIMTAPVGWLAQRFGRKQLFIASLAGFTTTSMMCGAAQSLEQIVVFRVLQGVCGAAIAPLSQAVMLDIYPIEQRAQAMAIFGIGIMVGPIMGPTLGGYLTDTFNWRWVFYVNLPFGIIATTGLLFLMPTTSRQSDMRFDWTGFSVLAIGISCLQLMLDRGQTVDWFNAREIIVEAVLAGLGFYLFIVHMFTAEEPFLPLGLFKDRNFTTACTMMFCAATVQIASSALIAPYLQNLAGYPVSTAGLTMAPRGIGTMVSMLIAGRIGGKYVDQRKLMALGLIGLVLTMHSMTTWHPDMPQGEIIATLIFQGFSMGFVYNPMTVVAFATLPASLRNHGAAMENLAWYFGAAIGVSVTAFMMVRSQQVSHAELASVITPFNRVLQHHGAVTQMLDPATTQGAALLNEMIDRQAQIIAFNNDYRILMFAAAIPLLLLLLMRGPGGAAPRPLGEGAEAL